MFFQQLADHASLQLPLISSSKYLLTLPSLTVPALLFIDAYVKKKKKTVYTLLFLFPIPHASVKCSFSEWY